MFDTLIRGALVVDGTGAAPAVADVGLSAGQIAALGQLGAAPARQTIDAAGLVLTPGFIDIHTHYDGQVSWDAQVTPSSLHGVTTVVMGNCGVGFAPVRPADRAWLIRLMEGVEDIPGTVLSEGIRWEWETFPEYLAALRARRYAIDIAAQIPHGPLRTYVMGARGADPTAHPSATELATMAALVSEALALGAVGFSTSRTAVHRASDGSPTPSLSARPEELLAIAATMAKAGRGVFELVSDFNPLDQEFELIRAIARTARRPVSVALTQTAEAPDAWRDVLARIAAARAEGLDIHAQVAARPISVMMGLSNRVNFLLGSATYRGLLGLPLGQQVAALREPATRAAVLADLNLAALPSPMLSDWSRLYRFDASLPYLPGPERCVARAAAAAGVPPAELALDWLLANDGQDFLFLPARNYVDGTPAVLREMLASEHSIVGLADGGAHCSVLSDAGMPVYLLTAWRQGQRQDGFALEWLVHQLTQTPAASWGLTDRGVIAPGLRADLNLIDLERLALLPPRYERDLPAGGGRLVQKAQGIRMSLVAGVPVVVDGQATGKLPGRLIGPQ